MSQAVVGAKKSSEGVFENYFETNYAPLPLPMIWRVIYHEAVRGNHILWNAAELESIEQQCNSPEFKLQPGDSGVLAKFMAKFFHTANFGDLQSMIATLNDQQKAVAFLLYRRAITVWQKWLKTNLH